MRLSVVIPTRNRAATVVPLLDNLAWQIRRDGLVGQAEIVIVDDHSGTAERGKLRAFLAGVAADIFNPLFLTRHRGASAARNIGLEKASGDLVAFLDDDLIPAVDYIRRTIEVHHRNPRALVINGDLKKWRDDVYSDFWFSRYDRVFNRPGQHFYPVAALASGHFSVKRALARRIRPLFDEGLPSREDFDLYLRLLDLGIPVHKSDQILAYNLCRSSLWGLMRQYAWYARGEYFLRRKHGAARIMREQARVNHTAARPAPESWRLLPVRLAVRLSSTVAFNYESYRHQRDPVCLLRIADAVLFAGTLSHLRRRFKQRASA